MVHTASSTESDWFLPYDGPIEPPPPPTRHPFAAELPQPKPVPATSAHARSKSSTAKSESRERTGRDRSRSRSRDAKRKSQRSYVALDAGGGVGAYPAPEREHKDREKERSSVQSDFTFGESAPPGAIDLQYTFPPVDESTVSTGGKSSDPPIVFANHPFRMHTGSPPPRGHTALLPCQHHVSLAKLPQSRTHTVWTNMYDMRSHPYATTAGPVRETRFGSVSTTTTTTTGGTGKPPVPPRPIGLKLKSSLKPSMSTPELRLHIPSSAPAAIPRQVSNQELSIPAGVGVGPRMPRSAGAASGSAAAATSASGGATGLEGARDYAPAESDCRGGWKPRVCPRGRERAKGVGVFPRTRSRNMDKEKEKEKEKERPGEDKFKTVAEVLRDGDQLEKEREEWNAMGQSSLLNNRTRSLSRSQSRVGGARVGGPKMRRETIGGNGESGWGTLKLKKSVEMLAATALSQGHGHAPSASVSSSHRRGGGTQGSVSTVSHARGASASVASRAHSRADSWGQRVVCGSRSGSSLGDDGPGGHMGHSNIRPIPTGDTHRARAPPPPPPVNPGFGVPGPSGRPQTQRLSPGPNYAGLMPVQPPPSPGDSTIGLALSFLAEQRSFCLTIRFRTELVPILPSNLLSGSTERARLDEPNHVLRPSRSAPPLPSTKALPPLQMKFPLGPGKSMPSPEHQPQHPFVTRPVMLSTASGEVQRMFESAMLRSVVTSSGREWDRRRGSGDSGLGSSVNDHGIEMHRAGGRKVSGSSALAGSSLRGSAFGPPGEFEEIEDAPAVEEEKAQEHERVTPGSSGLQPPAAGESEKAVSPMGSVQSPFSLMDSLAPSSRRGLSTRVSSGMIDPALAGTAISPMLSHESSSSSFSSPRPLASIDDIESLRGIFYRPSPVRNTSRLPSSQESSPRNEPVLDEESNESGDEEYGREITERYHDQEDWTFGRPLESQHDTQPLWERRRENHQQPDKTPLRIDLAPGTPSPTCATAPLPPAPIAATPSFLARHRLVQLALSERSVRTTSSQRATNENLTFGFVRSPKSTYSVNAESRPHSTALSLIDMYDYEASISSSSPTPLNHQVAPYPFTHPTHDDSFLSPASAARPMDRVISGFPTPPADGTPMSSAVLSTYFNVDNQSSSRRSADERSCST
ncbi:phosphatase [Ceratobasidium sp. AG-Ba]|nr:phosphatase [Ceratobasidium sp. AG-Ba]